LINVFLLPGLRVSHFNEGNCGAPSDPTQKTITNFIASRDAKSISSSLLPDVMDNDFVSDTATNLSVDSQHTCIHDCRDPFDGDHSLDVDNHSCTIRKKNDADKVCIYRYLANLAWVLFSFRNSLND